MKVGITGVNGFIGSYLKLVFSSDTKIEIVAFDRSFFEKPLLMESFVTECDVVIHAASVIRHEDNDFLYKENIALTKSLLNAIHRTNSRSDLVFISTIQHDADTAYGKSKRDSEVLFSDSFNNNRGHLLILRLPGIFGENQTPYFNGVVPTFCSEILGGEKSKINEGAHVELLHVRHVVRYCLEYVFSEHKKQVEVLRPEGISIGICDLYEILTSFKLYRESNGTIPKLEGILEIDLFNTFRYFESISKGIAVFDIFTHADERGGLCEVVKSNISGQVFYSSSKEGVTRGNHYHTRKIERFCIIGGEGTIIIRNLFTNQVFEIVVTGKAPQAVDMPTCHVHSLKNTGSGELLSIFWVNEFFDPSDSDTYYVIK